MSKTPTAISIRAGAGHGSCGSCSTTRLSPNVPDSLDDPAKVFNRYTHANRVFFTVAEANKALPDVIKKFEMALAKKNNVARTQAEVETSVMSSLEDYVKSKKRLNTAVTEYYRAVETLEETGAVVKSIEQGLLDFPSRRFDEEVWLCWKYGETKIGFWHEKDSGFAGRKPLAASDESLV